MTLTRRQMVTAAVAGGISGPACSIAHRFTQGAVAEPAGPDKCWEWNGTSYKIDANLLPSEIRWAMTRAVLWLEVTPENVEAKVAESLSAWNVSSICSVVSPIGTIFVEAWVSFTNPADNVNRDLKLEISFAPERI